MKGFRPESLPVYETLVREFPIFDRWLSSIPGPMQPNRLFMNSSSSHGLTSHVKKQLALGYPQKAIFDSLQENEMVFGIYFWNIPSTLFYRNLRELRYVSNDLEFKRDARNSKLPILTVIEPSYFDVNGIPANADQPSHYAASRQRHVKEVYEMLRPGPQCNGTLFITTFDECGDFYDHVITPKVDVPIPEVSPLRDTEATEDGRLSEFQSEMVQLAAVLNGDHLLSSFLDEMTKTTSVKDGKGYVEGAVARFIAASKEAFKLRADSSGIVDMHASITTR